MTSIHQPPSARFPGPLSKAMLDELARYVITDPFPFAVDLAASRGMWLATVDGDRLFDWTGLYASHLLGYNHPRLSEPDYVRRLVVAANTKMCNPDYLTRECLDYYRLIHELAPVCMRNPRLEVYTVNSGAEAVENMMKYLINLHDQKLLQTGRLPTARRFLYFDQAFHGRTVFALNVTQMAHDPVVTKDFHGFVPGNIQVEFPAVHAHMPADEQSRITRKCLDTVEDFLRRYAGEIVGIIIEPIQGAGGHRVAQPEFFRGLSELAHRYEVGLGFDEVQTAGGPCGAFFAIDLFDLPHPPQAVATAKKLGNGVVYMLRPMEDRGVLDSTWGGALADMVRFVEEMKIVREERLIEQTPAKAGHLCRRLDDLCARYPDRIFNRRGLGLYQGFSLPSRAMKARLLDIALEEQDLLMIGAGIDSIRLRPTLDVTHDEIDLFADRLEAALRQLRIRN